MTGEKADVKKQNSKTGFKKVVHAWGVEGVFLVSDSCPSVVKAGLSY